MTNAELQELEAEWAAIEANTSADEFGRVDIVTIKKIAATVRKVLGVTEKVSMKSLPQFIIRIAQLSSGEHSTIDDIKDAVDDLGDTVSDNTTAIESNTSKLQEVKVAVSSLKTYTIAYQNENTHGINLQNLTDYTVSGECIVYGSDFTISLGSSTFTHGFLSYVRIHNPWVHNPDSIEISNAMGSGKVLKVYINAVYIQSVNNNNFSNLTNMLKGYGVLNMVFECDGVYMNCYIQGLEE